MTMGKVIGIRDYSCLSLCTLKKEIAYQLKKKLLQLVRNKLIKFVLFKVINSLISLTSS